MKNWTKAGCPRFKYAHGKLDGHFMYLQKLMTGEPQALTKKPVDITGYFHDSAFFHNFNCDATPGTVLYGELFLPGFPASQVKAAILDRDPDLRYHVFASTNFDAKTELHVIQRHAAACGQDFVQPWLTYDEVKAAGGLITIMAEMPHLEGFVLKGGNLSRWLKYKRTDTLDLVVTDLIDGKGKNLGLIGSLELSDRCHVVRCNCNLKSDEQRMDVTIMGEDVIGRIVEVEYDYIDAGGRLRFPRFVRFRDDKTVADVVEGDELP